MTDDTFTFSASTSGIRVRHVSSAGVLDTFHLTFVMWEELEKAQPGKNAIDQTFLELYCPMPQTTESLTARGLVEKRTYRYSAQLSYTTTTNCALTVKGEALRSVLPKCPPREQWPVSKSPKKQPVSVDNVRVTTHQRMCLNMIRKGTWSAHALYDATKTLIAGGWHAFGEGQHPLTTDMIKKFLIMELVELGVDVEGLRLVCRVTVHGALLADGE